MASSRASKSSIDALMRAPPSPSRPYASPQRTTATHAPTQRFTVDDKTYQQQFSSMYFLRLAALKPTVDAAALAAWDGAEIAGEPVRHVDRVLNVRLGEMCWIAGTVYVDMPLKPNILDDITKDHWIAPPPPRDKYTSPGEDRVMLEDESGRLRLTGGILGTHHLVTGCVVAVMGSETAGGDFEVLDLIIPDLPPPPPPPPPGAPAKGKVVLCSGLAFRGGRRETYATDLLQEWLLGELGDPAEQHGAADIVRLVLAGNSLGAPLGVAVAPVGAVAGAGEERAAKKYGYDASAYDASPARALDSFLAQLLPSLHVTVMPGETDPANVSVPQQPLHPAIFTAAKAYGGSTFERATNPWGAVVGGVAFLGTAGQNLDDVYRYVEGDDRLAMAERLLRWRLLAPTAPDTLWSYPFRDQDRFVIEECPQVFFVGNQDRFETGVVSGVDGQRCRVVLVPRFAETGEVVVVDLETLEAELVKFQLRE